MFVYDCVIDVIKVNNKRMTIVDRLQRLLLLDKTLIKTGKSISDFTLLTTYQRLVWTRRPFPFILLFIQK